MVVNHSGDKSNLGTLQNVSSAPFTAMPSPERVNDLQNYEEINLQEIEDLIIPPRAQSQHQFNRRTEVPLANRNSMHDEDDLITEGTFKENVSVRIRGPASPERQQQYGFRRFLRYIGPGLMMSVAYMDPGNVGAAITSRSLASYSLLWTILLRTLLGFLLQTRAINLGVATGHHLAQHCRIGYPKPVRYILWLMTELALLFGDFQETLGTSIALYVISMQKLPLWAGTLITNLVTFLLLQLESLGIRRLEALFTVSIAIMAFFFGAQYIAAAPPQGDVVKGIFIPFATKDTLRDALGTISSGVVPHNIYLHSTLVLSRRINRQNERFVEESILNNTVDTAIALFISFIVNVFVVSTFAGLDYSPCGNRSNVLLINAASCLVSNFGSWALYVWAIALFASGQSSACHGAYTGSFVLSGLMNVDMSCIRRTVIVRLISIGPSIAVALYATDINSAKLIQGWLNVIQALQLPLVLIPLLTFTMSVKTMGKFVNSPATSVLAILASLLLVALNFYFSFPFIVESLPSNGWMHATLGVLAVSYLGFVAHLFFLCFGGIAHVYYYLTTGQKYNEKNEPNMQLHLNEGFIPAPLPVDEATINARANMMDPITGTLLTPFDISAGLPAHLMVSAEDAIVFQHFWET